MSRFSFMSAGVVVLFLTGLAWPCLHVPADYKGSLVETSQQAIIFWRAGREELILKVDYKMETTAELPKQIAWVVPVPHKPDGYAVVKSPQIFEEAFQLADTIRGRAFKDVRGAFKGPVLGKITVGEYEITELKATGPNAAKELNAWLKQGGYGEVPEKNMTYYVKHDWTFLAIKINKDDMAKELAKVGGFRPLRISFQADRIYYPLKFSSHQGEFDVTLFVFTEQPVALPKWLREHGFTNRELPSLPADSKIDDNELRWNESYWRAVAGFSGKSKDQKRKAEAEKRLQWIKDQDPRGESEIYRLVREMEKGKLGRFKDLYLTQISGHIKLKGKGPSNVLEDWQEDFQLKVANENIKKSDYVTKDGKLKHKLELRSEGTGILPTWESWVIEPAGEWSFSKGQANKKLTVRGKLTPNQLASLAAHLVGQDMLGLPPQFGDPGYNPTLAMSFGKNTTTLSSFGGPPENGAMVAEWSRFSTLVLVIQKLTTDGQTVTFLPRTEPAPLVQELKALSLGTGYLYERVLGAHWINLNATLDDKGKGKGKLFIDRNTHHRNEFGDPTDVTEMAIRAVDITLEAVKLDDPAKKGRKLYEIRGPEFTTRLFLVVSPRQAGSHRLIVRDEKGAIKYVLPLKSMGSAQDRPRLHEGPGPDGDGALQTPPVETARLLRIHARKDDLRGGTGKAGNYVIRADEAWKKLWNGFPPPDLKIDFSEHMALVIFEGSKSRRQPTVTTIDVLDKGNVIEAVVHFSPRVPGHIPVLADMISPSHVVVIDKPNKAVKFVLAFSENPKNTVISLVDTAVKDKDGDIRRVVPLTVVTRKTKTSAARLKGMKAAVADLEAGKLALKEPPLPDPAWHGEYWRLLQTECGLERILVKDFSGQDVQDEMGGYNGVMQLEIEHRFGKGILKKLADKAQEIPAVRELKELQGVQATKDTMATGGFGNPVVTGPLQMRLIAKKDTYVLDLDGKSLREFRKHLGDIRNFWPPPGPAVDMVLEITNTRDVPVTIMVGGDDTSLSLELKGPGAVNGLVSLATTDDIKHSKAVELAPGKSYRLPIKSLDHPYPRPTHRWYWTEPGEYSLSATYQLGKLASGKAGPKLVSAPIKLKVEAQVTVGREGNDLLVSTTIRVNGTPHVLWTGYHDNTDVITLNYCLIQNRDWLFRSFKNVTIEWRLKGYAVIPRAFRYRVEASSMTPTSQELKELQRQLQALIRDEAAVHDQSLQLSLTTPYLDNPIGRWRRITLNVTLDDKGNGRGSMVLDPNLEGHNAFGDVTSVTQIATRSSQIILKQVKIDDPAKKGRRLYEIQGTSWFLVVSPKGAGPHRLIVKDKDGNIQRVLPLEQGPDPRPPCHPGCFPAGTIVLTPGGPRPIETIAAGDHVLGVDGKGKTYPAKVQSVFVTSNRLVKVATEAGVLFTTQTQPLCLSDGAIRPAGELNVGDKIFRWQDGRRQAVKVLGQVLTDREEKVFNLVLGGSELFIAGGFLARSKPPADAEPPAQETSLALPGPKK